MWSKTEPLPFMGLSHPPLELFSKLELCIIHKSVVKKHVLLSPQVILVIIFRDIAIGGNFMGTASAIRRIYTTNFKMFLSYLITLINGNKGNNLKLVLDVCLLCHRQAGAYRHSEILIFESP